MTCTVLYSVLYCTVLYLRPPYVDSIVARVRVTEVTIGDMLLKLFQVKRAPGLETRESVPGSLLRSGHNSDTRGDT